MLGKRNNTLMIKVFVIFVCFAITTTGFAARIIPTGKVYIIKDGNVIGEFSREAPLLEGILLRCEERCVVKLDDVYMVAEPDTVFSVSPMANHHDILLQQGTMYYSLNQSSRPLNFDTPAGNTTTGELTLTDDELRGYVRVVGNETEIGVIGGGTMMVETDSTETKLTSGKKLTMTLADSGKATTATSEEEGMSRNIKIVLGVVGGALLAGGIIALTSGGSSGGSGGDGSGDGSPSSP